MTDEATLLSDQVFQLNTFLWALEDLPTDGDVRPVLRQADYYLGAIGRRLLMPTDERTLASVAELVGTADRKPCRPDLWLKHATDLVQPLVELKAQGFSPDSSDRRQALKLIASATDLALSLGESDRRPGHVLYATVASDAQGMASTLKTLAQQLRSKGADPAPTGAIGLAIKDECVVLSSPDPVDLPEPLRTSLVHRPAVLCRDGDNDLQPLYFIPWIPGIEENQDPELHAAGLQELTARVLIFTHAAVGQALPPTSLTLSGSRLLSKATFGVFDRWLDTDKQEFSAAAARIVDKVLKPVVQVRRLAKESREIDLPDSETKEAVIERLENADPADPSANLQAVAYEQQSLFDES